MVEVNSGPERVRLYVKTHGRRGLPHVIALVRKDRDAMAALTSGLSQAEANLSPADEEYSVLQVLQHLNGSFERSLHRLETLSSGRAWINENPAAGSGSIPPDAPALFADVRRQFLEGEDRVLALLGRADPLTGLELTADHAEFGAFNWLEWAVYSHHVHTHDHVGQIETLRREIEKRRQELSEP